MKDNVGTVIVLVMVPDAGVVVPQLAGSVVTVAVCWLLIVEVDVVVLYMTCMVNVVVVVPLPGVTVVVWVVAVVRVYV